MRNSHETDNKQAAASAQKKKNSSKWVVGFLCFGIILSLGIFANYQRTISAGGMTTTAVEPVRHSEISQPVQTQELLKMMRNTDKLATTPSLWPVVGTVTSRYGWRVSPWNDGNEFHAGIDIANGIGTPIVATADGKVVQNTWADGYGNLVQIDHGNGIVTLYGHNSQVVVKVGQNVKKGQVISYMGSTGRSTGPHVHYEVRVNDNAIDPVRFMVQY